MKDFYDFFAGGGMALAGLGDAWRCLYANDIDANKGLCYAKNWGDEHLQIGDVQNVRPSSLPGKAHLAWASFPCQDLSLAGGGEGLSGARSGTFWPFWRLVERLRAEGRPPRVVVLENVCGALTSHGGKDFAAIAGALVGAGIPRRRSRHRRGAFRPSIPKATLHRRRPGQCPDSSPPLGGFSAPTWTLASPRHLAGLPEIAVR